MAFGIRRAATISLALQGGGAHGAFTWGVLDGLLEDGRIRFDGVSGTSAGAMNAVVLAHGLLQGGRDGARAALEAFWGAVARSMPAEMTVASNDGNNVSLAPMLKLMMMWTQYFAPGQINPFNVNPLRDIVATQIDFERLRAHSPVKLFIAATHANSGKLKLFRGPELSIDTVLASACLPALHRAVEIGGKPYWDGGYAANPAVFPLFYDCTARDVMLVLLSPLSHNRTPYTAKDIKTRVLEIAFNANFLREMSMIAQLREHIDRSWLVLGRFERRVLNTHFHVIDAPDIFGDLSAETKLAANGQFFKMLKRQGRDHAQQWLAAHRAQLGKRSTVNLSELFS